MRRIYPLLCGLTICASLNTNSAEAGETSSPFLISARAGTLGVGPEIEYHRQNSHWGVRGDFDYYNISLSDVKHEQASFSASGANYAEHGIVNATYGGRARLINGSILGDYYPWRKSAFRLTSGVIFSGSSISGKGVGHAQGSTTIGGRFTSPFDIPNAGYVGVKAHYAIAAPYVGLGFNTPVWGGFHINMDAGVMFHDDADIHTSPGGMMNDFPKAYSKLKTIADRKIHNYMDRKLPVYPVLMIGVGYRF